MKQRIVIRVMCPLSSLNIRLTILQPLVNVVLNLTHYTYRSLTIKYVSFVDLKE